MNNKKLGTAFEQEVCELYKRNGYWVHFITPDARGAQPFDIIAVKNDEPYAIECKTLTTDKKSFSFDRLEDNQILASEKWMKCGNKPPMIVIKYGDEIYVVDYLRLKKKQSIKISDCYRLKKEACNV